MVVPDFQSIMLPLLRIFQDEKEHSLNEVLEKISQEFNLSAEDKKELLPSGRQRRYDNRVGWARTYLTKAGLLEKAGGKYRITERGKEVLLESPEVINIRYLKKYPEFKEFIGIKTPHDSEEREEEVNGKTPEEVLLSGYQRLRKELAQELFQEVKKSSPKFFENLVIDLLVSMGYGGSRKDAGEAIGRTKDGGVDGIIKEDKLGLDVIYIQAKKWEHTWEAPKSRLLPEALKGKRPRKVCLLPLRNFHRRLEIS